MANELYEPYMKKMREAESAEVFYRAVRGYMLARLGLPAYTKEDTIRTLVKFSVQMQLPDADPVFLEEKLAGTDCHQTSYIISKQTLLMMELERVSGLKLTPEQADDAETVRAYARLLWNERETTDGHRSDPK